MTPNTVFESASRIAVARLNPLVDAGEVKAALIDLRKIRSWADANEAALVTRLDGLVSFPEAAIAETSKGSLGQAGKTKERAGTVGRAPALATALEQGAITAGHIDAVTRAKKQLDADQHDAFLDRVDQLTNVATAATTAEFTGRLDLEVKRLQRDDGESRLVRQKKATRLSTWTDGDGMWNIRGRFDPELAVKMAATIDTGVATLFAEVTPEFCPSDPVEKNKFLAAHTLARLVFGGAVTGRSGRTGRPEFVAVIDADAPNVTGPVAEWALPIELPARVVADLAGNADVVSVVVRNGVVVHAPGELDLGRTTRLANRPQRRALRALYRHCAIPGCCVSFDRCKLHHIVWWRNGGLTDLDNLLPVCSRHHGNIHNDNWIVELGPHRELSLRLPDGTLHNSGPPKRRIRAGR